MLTPSQPGAAEFVYLVLEPTDLPPPGAADSLRRRLEPTSETLKKAQITTAVVSMNYLLVLICATKMQNFAPVAQLKPPYL